MRQVAVREAAVLLHTARRIMVIGCSGSGKSTLSRRLCARFDLPYVSMDRDIFWLPGWVMRERSDIIAKVEKFAAGSDWVFDGNNTETMPARLLRADLVLWLAPPRRVSLWGAMKRIAGSYGEVRADMAPGCPERIDFAFLRYIWNFNQVTAPRLLQMIELKGGRVPVCMLKSHREMNELLALSGGGH
ncbi:AAA family ATPase [Martelella radicis]|uniref:Adenylate kinase family enzyme n=1 Tax=Martelella radicis TaxID=1397476 RepID=A0A7W6KG39_9HYPH|nr:AAA family ATPase [Martelella radicis]MBB4120452.1 adenylate kinase family enzyme [Martelella radicis]